MLLQFAIVLPLLAEAFSDEYHKIHMGRPPPKNIVSTTVSEEDQIRSATESCLQFWSRASRKADQLSTRKSSDASPPGSIHKECIVTFNSGGNNLTSNLPGESFCLDSHDQQKNSLVAEKPIHSKNPSHQIHWIKILPVGSQSAATVRVTCQPSTEGFLSFLKSSKGWVCIHAAFSSKPKSTILPWDFQEVNQLTWDRYRQANRLCDGKFMATAFHETCRLTFVAKDHQRVVVIPQPEFCDMVQNRYTLPPHSAFAPLQEHPDVECYDSLQAIEFASSDLCLVTLKVGHPPFLWTDFLVCCNMGEKGWWIVHKASCQEDFELNEEMKKALKESSTLGSEGHWL